MEISLKPSAASQVSGGIKDAPDIINGILHILVCQFLADGLCNGFAIDQPLDIVPCRLVRFFQQAADQIVSAGIGPVILWFSIFIFQQDLDVFYNIPRAVNGSIAKLVSIIPVANLIMEITRS